MKSNNGILDSKDLEKRTKFWNKKTFRTFSKRELERDSNNMQKLLEALKFFTKKEVQDIHGLRNAPPKRTAYYTVWSASNRDLEFAISILPKVKQS